MADSKEKKEPKVQANHRFRPSVLKDLVTVAALETATTGQRVYPQTIVENAVERAVAELKKKHGLE